jgi:hypothetical protein
MENVDESSDGDKSPHALAMRPNDIMSLKPKGACWYCNAPLDNVRRFCNKTCAEDYRSEEATFNDSNK